MIIHVEYRKGQNKAFISDEKVIIFNYHYKVWELCTVGVKVISFEENYLVLKKAKNNHWYNSHRSFYKEAKWWKWIEVSW